MTQMQGIVSILRSDNDLEKTITPLRRTLSADMSSKRWLADSGLPMMKKIASSEQIAAIDSSSSSSESDEEECDQVNGKGEKNPTRMDIWTAIMSQKKQDDSGGKLPPPYVHPLVKKSARSLSEKSLKVCTESLGSETGSDVVFMFNPVVTPDVVTGGEQHKPEEDQLPQQPEQQNGEQKLVKQANTKKSQVARSFPPPLPSLAAAHTDGPSLHMHSRRVEGRLVVEAVSVPPQKFFEAQRQHGRFLLALIKDPIDEQPQPPTQNEFVDVFDISDEEKTVDNVKENEEEEDEMVEMNLIDKDIEFVKEEPPLEYYSTNNSFINHLHKSTNKLVESRDNENPTWSRKLAAAKVEEKEEEAPPITAVQSLPPRTMMKGGGGRPPLPRPPTSTATSVVNSYQYFWRAKPSVASVIDPMITQHPPPTKTKDMVLLRGNKADCTLMSANSLMIAGCKVPRKSLVMWEPFCIATS